MAQLHRSSVPRCGRGTRPEDRPGSYELRRLRNGRRAHGRPSTTPTRRCACCGQCDPKCNAGSASETGRAGRCAAIKAILKECADEVAATLADHRAAALADLLGHLRDFTLAYADDRTPRGDSDFPRSADVGARSAARPSRRARAAPRRGSTGSSSTSSRTPTRCRRRSPGT